MAYKESNRYLYLDTPLGADQLLLTGFSGQEGLSQLFEFHLELIAENDTGALCPFTVAVTVSTVTLKGGADAPA